MKNKVSLLAILTVACVTLAVTCVALSTGRKAKSENFYRTVEIYDLDGTAEIERTGVGTIRAMENLLLESGDRVTVGEDSTLRLKIDGDKYIFAEPDTVFSLTVEGSSLDSQTAIYLERGALTNEIQNKLSSASSYEVTTPNSLMAVRGTVYRVEVYFNGVGESYSKLTVYNGNVETYLITPTGEMEDGVAVPGGQEIIVHGTKVISEYLSEPLDISYEDLSEWQLEFLLEQMDDGMEVPDTTREELEALLQKKAEQSGYVIKDPSNIPSESANEQTLSIGTPIQIPVSVTLVQ